MSLVPRRTPRLAGVLAVVAVAVVAASCTSTSAGDQTLSVTATDTECRLDASSFPPGSLTVEVANSGGEVTEVYLYGQGDRIVGEVENVGPGTTRRFTADVAGGTYEVACKPGMTGDGIRSTITVSGTATTQPTPDRTVAFDAHDFDYTGLNALTVRQGETVEFVMTNDAPDEEHEFEVSGPDGAVLGEIGPTAPGATGRVVLTLDRPGTYTYVCGIADHEAKGMTGSFTVAAA